MGGIPWQSQGCKTCKQRRIKCDLQQPECARCIKRGLSCPGYVKGRIFIHHTSVQPAVASNQLKYVPPTQIVLPGRPERITVAPQFMRDGPQIRAQLSSVLFHAYVPLEPNRTGGIDAWLYLLEQFLALPNKSEMLERAITALSCIYVGKMNGDSHLIRHGVQQYNLSIRLMHGMLRRNIRTPEVLYVTVIFQVLEALYCPNGLQVWIAHQDGMHALLRYFRPTTPCNLLVRAIYENQQKIHFMFSATASKRIGGPRHPPVYSFEGGLLNELFNLFLNIVSILEKLEDVDRSDYGNCQDLLEMSLAQKKAMITWYHQRLDEIGGAPTPCAPGTILCPQLPPIDDLFGPAYNFSSLDNAIIHLLYWTAMILTQSLIYQTKCCVVYYGKAISSDPTTNEEFKLTGTYAAQICRAVPYCLQPKMRLGGAHATVATLNQVCKTYAHRRCRQHYQWCQNAYRHIADLGLDSTRLLYEGNMKYWDLCTNPYVNSVLSLTLRFAVPPELLQFLQSMGSSEGKIGSSEQPIDIYDPRAAN